MQQHSFLPLVSVFVVIAGCGPSAQYCEEVEDGAVQHVLEVVEADQPCTVDEDCQVVGVSGSCFDVCSRVIAVANTEAFETALDEAETDHCADYDGCTLIIPPCAPPDDAYCGDDGQCQGG